MIGRAVVVALALGACGRIGFDPLSSDDGGGSNGDAGATGDALPAACMGTMNRPGLCNARTAASLTAMGGETLNTLRVMEVSTGYVVVFGSDQGRLYFMELDHSFAVTHLQYMAFASGATLWGGSQIGDNVFMYYDAGAVGFVARIAPDRTSYANLMNGQPYAISTPIGTGGGGSWAGVFDSPTSLALHPIDNVGVDTGPAPSYVVSGASGPLSAALADSPDGAFVAVDHGNNSACDVFTIRTSDHTVANQQTIPTCIEPRLTTLPGGTVGMVYQNTSLGAVSFIDPYTAGSGFTPGTATAPRIATICNKAWVFFVEGINPQLWRQGDQVTHIVQFTEPFDVSPNKLFWIENATLKVADPCVN